MVQLNGKKRFLEVGDEVTVSKTQTLMFFINLERKRFTLGAQGRPYGEYVVKFFVS